jgi:ketosteroid isomerase-like protein
LFHSSAFGVAAWNPRSYKDGVRCLFLFVPLLIATAALSFGQSPGPKPAQSVTPKSHELFETIETKDAELFDAFNRHNVEALMEMFTDDLEFFHDTGGVTNHQQTKDNFAKMFGNIPDITRTMVEGTLEVYPIKDYGAIEVGAHRFCHTENGKEECGSFKFVHVWRKVGDTWKISRVISYGH